MAPVCEKTSTTCLRSSPSAFSQAETFGEARGVDVHDHVDESFHLGGLAGLADILETAAHVLEDRLGFAESFFGTADH